MKIKLDDTLAGRARKTAEKAGYSSLEEFIEHIVEKELARLEEAESREEVVKQLRGLGYLE
ncbi:MAG: hypothetical protein KGN84_05625 [Acidobacteriota bacterium]|nr:hypothetical protein [Acidobacteriota bacterium]